MKKKCKICGQYFETDDSKRLICEGKHFNTCISCGKKFEMSKSGKPANFCSRKCGNNAPEWYLKEKYGTRVCDICGKEFVPKQKSQNICSTVHYFPCPVCGKMVKNVGHKRTHKCCSKECAVKLRKSTNMKKYGVPVSSQAECVKRKAEETCLKRYGVRHAAQNEDVKKKVKEDWLKKYGVDSPMKLEEVKEKQRQTSLRNYGVDHPWKSKEVQEKRKKTWISNYGVDNPNKNKKIQERQKNTLLKRYGVDNTAKIPGVMDKIKKKQFELYGTWYLNSKENRSNRSRPISQRNLEFAELLNCLDVPYEMEFCFSDNKRKKFDFHIVGTNLLIEIDSTAVHNSYKHLNGIVYDNEITSKQIEKSNIAENHGYHCVHLFDWDDVELFAVKLTCKCVPSSLLSCVQIDFDQAYEFFRGNDCQILDEVTEDCTFYGYKDANGDVVSCLCVYPDNTARYCDSVKYAVEDGIYGLFKKFNLTCTVVCDSSKMFIGSSCFEQVKVKQPRRIWSKDAIYVVDSNTLNYNQMISEGWLPVHDCGITIYRYIGKLNSQD